MKKEPRRHVPSRMGKAALSAVLAVGLMPGFTSTAFASENNAADSDAAFDAVLQQLFEETSSQVQQYLEDGSTDTASTFDYTEGQSVSTLSADTLPSAFSLRNVNPEKTEVIDGKTVFTGGDNYVTSVKWQNPFGSCWAFAATAASEASILYEEGVTADEENLDLSERHLAWFGNRAIDDESNSQNGEGTHYVKDPGSASMNSGTAFQAASCYAMGEGVVTEETAPYHGVNSLVTCFDTVNEKVVTCSLNEAKEKGYKLYYYSDSDDWSLPETSRFAQAYKLEEANILPSVTPTVNDEGVYVKNDTGINAIKDELYSGSAVMISFCADTSMPGQTTSANRFMNENFAHYAFQAGVGVNHGVTIVGWDDNYSASNFGLDKIAKWDANKHIVYTLSSAYIEKTSDIPEAYQKGGELTNDPTTGTPYYVNTKGETVTVTSDSDREVVYQYTGEEAEAISTPAGDGAWIVKNSWGAEGEGFPNENPDTNWGVDGSGYFYISYYDMSVTAAQTFDFITGDAAKSESDYSLVNEYDCLPAQQVSSITTGDVTKMANVFATGESMNLTDVSVETTKPGTTAEIEIYKLTDDSESPTDGQLVATVKETFPYGGYHRITLDNPVFMSSGQIYSVVVAETYTTVQSGMPVDQSTLCVNSAINKNILAQIPTTNSYSTGVINEGESWMGVQTPGTTEYVWKDWATVSDYYKAFNEYGSYVDYDNFSIKAYGEPATGLTVTFDANGHGTAPAAQTVGTGDTATEPTAPEAVGCTFGGWYTDAACTTAYNFATPVTKNTTLYAKWTVNENSSAFTRLAGDNAYGTMNKIVAEGWDSADTVVLASFDGYWDALSASSFAGVKGAPVIFTDPSELSAANKALIKKLGATNVVIVGGTAAVSEYVATAAAEIVGAGNVVRYAGDNAAATAVEIAKAGDDGSARTFIVATAGGYWDALAAGPLSYAKNAPILLANVSVEGEEGAVLDEATLSYLSAEAAEGHVAGVIVVGGTAAVSDHALGQIASIGGITTMRIAGDNAVDTSNAIAKACVKNGVLKANGLGIATVSDFHDALAGAALCGKRGAVLLLADSDNPTAAAAGFVTDYKDSIIYGNIFGGTAAVSTGVADALDAVIPPAKA